MCGICGEITLDNSLASAARLEFMADAMAGRGPDGTGVAVFGRVGLGHRRLPGQR